MKNLALFDLDHTLLPIDSDYEWGQFLVRIKAVDADEYKRRNDDFFAQYQAGVLDPVEYLEFALGTLARFPRRELEAMYAQYMAEVIEPAIRPAARDLRAWARCVSGAKARLRRGPARRGRRAWQTPGRSGVWFAPLFAARAARGGAAPAVSACCMPNP